MEKKEESSRKTKEKIRQTPEIESWQETGYIVPQTFQLLFNQNYSTMDGQPLPCCLKDEVCLLGTY